MVTYLRSGIILFLQQLVSICKKVTAVVWQTNNSIVASLFSSSGAGEIRWVFSAFRCQSLRVTRFDMSRANLTAQSLLTISTAHK